MPPLLTDLTAILRSTPLRWTNLTEHTPESLLRRQPAPGEWSALECLQHLIDMDRTVFPDRVRALLAEQDFPAFFPDDEGSALSDVSPAEMATTFAQVRENNLQLLTTVDAAALDHSATHAELGPVTLRNLLNEWGGHDLMHLVQAERAMMQPFIDGSGPWMVYFEDHSATKS